MSRLRSIARRSFCALLLSLLLPSCGSGRVQPVLPEPTQSGEETATPPGRIAGIDPHGDIFVVRGDGTGRIDLTDDASPAGGGGDVSRSYLLPTWGPSGDRLAYGEITRDAAGARRAAVVEQAVGEGDRQIVFESDSEIPIYLAWSSTGDKLGILTSGDAGQALGLWVAHGGQSNLIDRGQPYYLDWIAGGESLVVHVGGSAASDPADARLGVFRLFPGGRADWPLKPANFQAPAGRPLADSTLVAVADGTGGSELVVAGPDGQVMQQLVPISGAVAMAWSPDGQKVAYVEQGRSPHEGFGRLTILQLNDSPLARPIPTPLDSVAAFDWSPMSDRLIALVPRLSLDGGQQAVANRALQGELQFELQLVRADTGNAELLTVIDPTDAFLERLPFFDQYQRSSTLWSPDGRFLTFSAQRAGGDDGVFRIQAQVGATASLLAEGGLSFWSPN